MMWRLLLVFATAEVRRALMVLVSCILVFKSTLSMVKVILRGRPAIWSGATRPFPGRRWSRSWAYRPLVWVDRRIFWHIRLTIRWVRVSGIRVLRIVWRVVIWHWCGISLLLALLSGWWLARRSLRAAGSLGLSGRRTERRSCRVRLRDRQPCFTGLIMKTVRKAGGLSVIVKALRKGTISFKLYIETSSNRTRCPSP